MTLQPLPICPAPYPDELMSGWIERIGLFYDTGYDGAVALLHAHQGRTAWDGNEDMDADPELRESLRQWSGRRAEELPSLLDAATDKILGPPARLTYCPACWDQDVAEGRQPYIRCQWSSWISVHCSRHGSWLTGRRPRTKHEGRMNGWIGIWQSRDRWASAFDHRADASLEVSAVGFSPDTFEQPSAGWVEFESDVRRALGQLPNETADPFAGASIFPAIVSPQLARVRRDARTALQLRPVRLSIDDLDILCYRRARPAWIANRIACLATAVEIVRARDDRAPLFSGVRRIVDAARHIFTEELRCISLTKSGNFSESARQGHLRSHHW